MLVKTKYFGEIDLAEDKIITFEQGILGFEQFKQYTLLFDQEKDQEESIMWFQSVEEPSLALPVINPLFVKEDYNPKVDDEMMESLGELTEENLCILLTMTVTSDVKKTTANLKAPLIINSDTRKGCQVIADNPDYQVKYNVYDAVQKMKEKEGASC